MGMEEVRRDIDAIDVQLRELLMRRMDCSRRVAEEKQAAGSTDVYRADRERAILDKLGADVPEDRRAEYLAVVRKVMEASRMYQYGLIYGWNDGFFGKVAGSELADGPSSYVKVRLTREDRPNAMSSVLSMVGDYGYDMEAMERVETSEGAETGERAGASVEAGGREESAERLEAGADVASGFSKVTFDLTIRGDISDERMRCLMFQLSKEAEGFRILSVG